MKLISYIENKIEKTGILYEDGIKELNCSIIDAIKASHIEEFLEDQLISNFSEIRIIPPVKPSKVICVGLNYRDHAHELDMEIPEEPVLFIKPPTSVIGHLDPIIYPKSSRQLDYEAELAVIISRKGYHIDEKDTDHYIGGYTILNDVTARDLQSKDIQWTRAKSFNTFCPLGPCIETELNPLNQQISLKLNQKIKQSSNTKNMIFSPHKLVKFISDIMTLYPGDVIATGTPPGVGPMEVGDTVEAEVQDIGVLRNFLKKEL
ncbi:MAG: fumarylacetoacetate hydrolase family protein [Methanobacterium sp.]|nr:fumarylacetoacetate hydrolase family protein [Methanobacterium sp.]